LTDALRHQIDEIERRPGVIGETLTESFWVVELWRVHRACGCDVPRDVVFPENQAAAMEQARTAAASLADVTAVLTRQFEQQFWADRAAKGWAVPAPPQDEL
jgi:hypothetical protein